MLLLTSLLIQVNWYVGTGVIRLYTIYTNNCISRKEISIRKKVNEKFSVDMR